LIALDERADESLESNETTGESAPNIQGDQRSDAEPPEPTFEPVGSLVE